MKQRTTPVDLSYLLTVRTIAALSILLLIGPVIIVLFMSFTSSAALKFPPPGLTTRWYAELFDTARSAHIHKAVSNTLFVAAMATGFGTLMAVLAALSIARVKGTAAKFMEAGFLSPLILPSLAYGLATLMFFSMLGFRPSLNHLILGHLVVITPYIFPHHSGEPDPAGSVSARKFSQSGGRALLYLPPYHPAAHHTGHCRGRFSRLHRLDRQCPGLALSHQCPHLHAAGAHVGHDGIHA